MVLAAAPHRDWTIPCLDALSEYNFWAPFTSNIHCSKTGLLLGWLICTRKLTQFGRFYRMISGCRSWVYFWPVPAPSWSDHVTSLNSLNRCCHQLTLGCLDCSQPSNMCLKTFYYFLHYGLLNILPLTKFLYNFLSPPLKLLFLPTNVFQAVPIRTGGTHFADGYLMPTCYLFKILNNFGNITIICKFQ